MATAKTTRYLIETFDPEHPKTRVRVGASPSLEGATLAHSRLLAKGTEGWALEIVDTWEGWTPVAPLAAAA